MDELTSLSVAELGTRYRSREISPVEVTRSFLDRIDALDGRLNSFLAVTGDLALEQAVAAERRFAAGETTGPLTGIPIAVKDAFHLAGYPTTLGSAVHRGQISKNDSGVVRRLRNAGSVIIGKTNTAEFGQSATAENMLGPDNVNPWDLRRTPGGSSGGSASAVAARLTALSVGSDGGGSVRIPAAFCGVFGLKTSYGLCPDEKGFRGMTDFVGPGPMSSTVSDARPLLSVLAGQEYARRTTPRLRIAYAPAPEGWPVDAGIAKVVAAVACMVADLGHEVVEAEPPIAGWQEIFGPLVLEDEHRERGHLLISHADQLTRYERASLRAGIGLDPNRVREAQQLLPEYRARIADFFQSYDVILTPATATPAFSLEGRPEFIAGKPADRLWGPFPFSAPFNVAGVTASTLPSGLVDGLPVGAQFVAAAGAEQLILDLSQDVEEAVGFDTSVAANRLTEMAATAS